MENNMYGNNNGVNGQFGGPVAYQNPNQVRPVNCDEAIGVTSIMDLQRYAQGQVVRFPDFAEVQPFVAKVRRPSLMVLAKQGRIPNGLLESAGELFSKGGIGADHADANTLTNMYDITRIVCEACLVSPTLKQIEEAGMSLSDQQITAIFSYTQVGVKALEQFRKEQGDSERAGDVKPV